MDKVAAKLERLRRMGCALPRPERVRAAMFVEKPGFFDARDAVQVKYELLRAHMLDKRAVAAACRDFGFSRESFYEFAERLREGGVAGLLPQKRGRRGPVKCTREVLEFLLCERGMNPGVSGAELKQRLKGRLGVDLHRRTVERLMASRARVKKKPPEGGRGRRRRRED